MQASFHSHYFFPPIGCFIQNLRESHEEFKKKYDIILYFYIVKRPKEKKVDLGEGRVFVLKALKGFQMAGEEPFRESLSLLPFVFVVWTRLCILRRKNKNIGKTDIFGGWWPGLPSKIPLISGPQGIRLRVVLCADMVGWQNQLMVSVFPPVTTLCT